MTGARGVAIADDGSMANHAVEPVSTPERDASSAHGVDDSHDVGLYSRLRPRPWWLGRLTLPVGVDARGDSGPTPDQARGSGWRRTSRGLYVPQELTRLDPEQRILEVACALRRGAVTGWAALRWAGGTWFHGLEADGTTPRPVPVASALHLRTPPGASVTEERLSPADVTALDGVVITSHVRSVFNAMRAAGNAWEACAVAEMAMFNDLIDSEELRSYVAHHPRYIGVDLARAPLPRLEENAWSPQEVWMRKVWIVDAGLPRPLCNRPVFDRDGRLVGVPDLLDEEAGVVGEYDGVVHLAAPQRAKDVRREAAFRALGLEYVTMLAGDSGALPELVARILAARSRARFAGVRKRHWTVGQPRWWVPTETVMQRRELVGTRHEWLLNHRRLNR